MSFILRGSPCAHPVSTRTSFSSYLTCIYMSSSRVRSSWLLLSGSIYTKYHSRCAHIQNTPVPAVTSGKTNSLPLTVFHTNHSVRYKNLTRAAMISECPHSTRVYLVVPGIWIAGTRLTTPPQTCTRLIHTFSDPQYSTQQEDESTPCTHS